MKKYTLLLLLALSFFSGQIFAQDDDKDKDEDEEEVVFYNLVENEPMDGRNLSIAINPLIVDVYNPNLSFGAGLNAFYRFETLFAVEGNFEIAYADQVENQKPELGSSKYVPVYEIVTARNWNVLGRVYFFSRLIDKDEYVTVKSERKEGIDHITNTKIPIKEAKLYAVRGGVTSGVTSVFTESGIHPFKGAPVEGSNSGDVVEFSEVDIYNNMEYQYVSFGFSKTTLSDYIVDLKGYGERGGTSYAELYADVLYATNVSYDNIYIGETVPNRYDEYHEYVEYDLSESEISKIGGRIGITYKSIDKIGGYVNAEAGLRPGYPKGYYLLLKMGLNISGRVAAN